MKNWFQSRTIWIAILQFVVGGLVAISGEYELPGVVLMGKSLLDIVIRYLTVGPVK